MAVGGPGWLVTAFAFSLVLIPCDRVGADETESHEPAAVVDSVTAPQQEPQDPGLEIARRSDGQVFVQANEQYLLGDFEVAAALYSTLVERGLNDGRILFNLGNARLRNGELGRAIASYRQSRYKLPRDEDVLANLVFARSSAKDAIAPPDPPRYMTTLFFWHFGLSGGELAAMVLLVNLLFWGLWIVRLSHRDSEVLRWVFILLLVLLVTGSGSLAVGKARPKRVAVVVPQEISAHTAPEIDAVVRFKLHAGTEVAIRSERDDWLRITLPDGQQGWIERQLAEVVVGPW